MGDGQIAQNHSSANMSQKTKDKIFNNDLWGLQAADLAAFLVTGQDIDSGTAAEIWFFLQLAGLSLQFPRQNADFVI